ncbi:alpha/beta fold hydrolase [Micromonospora sp. KC207]|uniref:alpha/beta fold hydrolase n=1 Tax=Micromonospora sp. KC207 TaxID=2530377 RepID=UPI001043C50A|nr:alpha/beta fold hydrolase [Micromonospora sp. KC207]TDC59574.1 alpha/beta fold hydrolase [Micromonospora sp. KC207]
MTAPAVLLHGFMETGRGHFGAQVDAWRDERDVLAPDLPGHGGCRVDARRPYGLMVERYVLALLSRLGPVDMVAASYLGSPVAVRIAHARPDLVRSLVLTGLVPDVPADVFARWLGSFVTLAEQRPDVAEAYQRLHGPRWRATFDAFVDDARECYVERFQITETMLRSLPVPLLIANGSAKSGERDAALRAAGWGGTVRGVVIEHGGHIPGQDRPAEFSAAVRDFWDRM